MMPLEWSMVCTFTHHANLTNIYKHKLLLAYLHLITVKEMNIRLVLL